LIIVWLPYILVVLIVKQQDLMWFLIKLGRRLSS